MRNGIGRWDRRAFLKSYSREMLETNILGTPKEQTIVEIAKEMISPGKNNDFRGYNRTFNRDQATWMT